MKCSAFDPVSGALVEITYDSVITGIDHLLTAIDDPLYVAPGWIDLQVNGYAAVDYNSPDTPHEEIARSLAVQHATGTTRLYPTVITGSPENMAGSLRNLARSKNALGPAGESIEGFHVEGPHIAAEDGPRGAHPKQWVRPPDVEEYRRWQDAAEGLVKLITVSPEWPQAPLYIETVVRDGVVVSIGHMNANAQQIHDAVSAGATMSTHIGNGAHAVLPRHPNYIWEQLAEDRLAAGFIVDGIHLSASFFKVALRAKGVIRSVLVTDASMPAGAKPGRYRLGEVDVELTGDGRVVLAGGTRLAGSSLRLDRALQNAMRQTGISLPEAISMVTRNPARVGRIAGRQRGLAAGDRADLVLFRFDPETCGIQVEKTIVGGREVWARE
ncbi:MAG TPA: amidohydrolase family protein [Bryobacteraceae bacterium]|nr:amidohydrolase family protein [Bryobacteraceae bacterium]